MTEDGAAPKRRGRPPAPEEKRRRHNLTIRIRTQLLAELERRAASNGRSLSEEVEAVLEKEYTLTTDLMPLTVESDDIGINLRVKLIAEGVQSWREYMSIVIHAQLSAIELLTRCKNDDLIEPLLRLMNELSTFQLPGMHDDLMKEYYEIAAEVCIEHSKKSGHPLDCTKEQMAEAMRLEGKEDTAKRYDDFVYKSPTMSKSMKDRLDKASARMLNEIREAYGQVDAAALVTNDYPGYRAIYFDTDKNDNPSRQESLLDSFGFENASLVRGIENQLGHHIDDDIIYAAVEDKMARDMFVFLREHEKQHPGQKYQLQPWDEKSYDAQRIFLRKYGARAGEMYESVRKRLLKASLG